LRRWPRPGTHYAPVSAARPLTPTNHSVRQTNSRRKAPVHQPTTWQANLLAAQRLSNDTVRNGMHSCDEPSPTCSGRSRFARSAPRSRTTLCERRIILASRGRDVDRRIGPQEPLDRSSTRHAMSLDRPVQPLVRGIRECRLRSLSPLAPLARNRDSAVDASSPNCIEINHSEFTFHSHIIQTRTAAVHFDSVPALTDVTAVAQCDPRLKCIVPKEATTHIRRASSNGPTHQAHGPRLITMSAGVGVQEWRSRC
jgi:hypothetical protein